MRWQTKSRLFAALSALPFGFWLHRLLQRLFSRRLFRPQAGFAACRAQAARLVADLEQATGRKAQAFSVLEFGAGRDLAMALAFKAAGVGRVVALDVQPLARPWLVRRAAKLLLPGAREVRRLADLLPSLGIDYRAPSRLTQSALPDHSLDMIFSNEVLEHVPPVEIVTLLADAHRLLRSDGRLVGCLDYSDHYSHSDRRIGPHHFLRFDEKAWQRHNSALHYQNRLRHSEHVALWQAAGFEVTVAQSSRVPLSADESALRAGRFATMDLNDLAIINSELIARPQ